MLARRPPLSRSVYNVMTRAVSPKTNSPSLTPLLMRCLSTSANKEYVAPIPVHFRESKTPHPLGNKAKTVDPNKNLGDHMGRQQNHIWSEEELKDKLSHLYHHK